MSSPCACAPRLLLGERSDAPDTGDARGEVSIEQNGLDESARTRIAQIIVAEDDSAMRDLLLQALRTGGHDVVEARTGHELCARLDSFRRRGRDPDLVISDVRMPGCSGLSVLRSLNDENRFVPVILITAFGDLELHERAAQEGAVAVLDKPFDLDELCELASRVLRGLAP